MVPDRVTVDTGPTRWLTTEFGAALAVAIGATAWMFWRRRDAVTRPDEPVARDVTSASRPESAVG